MRYLLAVFAWASIFIVEVSALFCDAHQQAKIPCCENCLKTFTACEKRKTNNLAREEKCFERYIECQKKCEAEAKQIAKEKKKSK
jgi:hypothetical protein